MRTATYTPEPLLRRPGLLFRSMFADLWAGRELAWRLMVRNLNAMYRQTVLGYVWAFLPPIVAAATFILLRRSGVLTTGETPIPYAVWTLLGTFLWQVFTDAINSPMRQVSQAKSMLTKINFPREALILAGVGEVFFNFLIRLIVLIPVLIYFRQPISLSASTLLLPFALLSLIGMGVVIGVLLTPISILYQDIEKGIPLLLPFLMVLSGTVIPLPDEGIGKLLAASNPIVPVLDTCRDLLTGQAPDHLASSLAITGVMLALLLVGWITYRLSMPHLIARLGG